MGNDLKEDLNSIKYQKFETNIKRKNEIDKIKNKTLKIDSTFINNALISNNDFRIKHGACPLKSDDYLNKKAYILAEEFLIKGEFENENLLYKNFEELGMNIKMSNKKLDAEILMKKWYEESNDYNYKDPQELDCNNFTQMIWKKSINFGIGYYQLDEQDKIKINQKNNNVRENTEETSQKEYEFCYIALYYPAGNIPGEYKDNVSKEYTITQTGDKDDDFVIIKKEIEADYPDINEVENHTTLGEHYENKINDGNDAPPPCDNFDQ